MTPDGFDRRSFIKACAGVGAAGAAAAAGFGILRPISDVQVDIVPIRYPGIAVMEGSPAPYGLPLIPLEIVERDGEQVFRGRPDAAGGGAAEQLRWYKYCSHERAPGTEPGFDSDNLIEYYVTEEKIAKGFDAWYRDLIGDRIGPGDFPDSEPLERFSEFPGVGAAFRWRSEGVDSEDTITGIILKLPKDEFDTSLWPTSPDPGSDEFERWFPTDPSNEDEIFVACCSFCTHFCCVPGFHEAELAVSSGYGETVFCTCHLSRYDPFTVEPYDRTIFVFPDGEDEEDGSSGEGGGGH